MAPACRVTAIDIDDVALSAAQASVEHDPGVEFVRADFLTWKPQTTFDAVLANPPYLKHHNILYSFDIYREVGGRNGIVLSRLTNVYALFVLEACRRLNRGGRAALIVPGEWTNANFGDSLKKFLFARGLLKILIYFSSARVLFDDALTTASILLIENDGELSDITTAFVRDGCRPESLAALVDGPSADVPGVVVRRFQCHDLLRHGKWNHPLEHGSGVDEPGWVSLSCLASTRRGIATGANRFFHVAMKDVEKHQIDVRHAIPCIGKATDVQGLVFDTNSFTALEAAGGRTRLLVFDGSPQLNEGEARYLAMGEASGLPSRYLLAARKPWYAMEDRPAAPIWAAVFGRTGLRFIWNRAGVRNLTTFHCIYPFSTDPVMAGALSAVLNSRAVQSRSREQIRVYGGGLLKFEPKDLLDVRIPDLRLVCRSTVASLADALLSLDATLKSGSGLGREAAYGRLDEIVSTAMREAAAASTASSAQARPRPVQQSLQLS